jgi:hypothetical protein
MNSLSVRVLAGGMASLLLLLLGVTFAHAQDADPFATSAWRNANVFAGPGITHLQITQVAAGVPVTIFERNRVGDWIQVRPESNAWQGWVMTAFFTLDPALRLSEVPVNTAVNDGNPDTVDRASLKTLYDTPIISPISDALREVFTRGLLMGNQRNVATKVGDSVTADEMYLLPMNRADNVLGAFDFLADTLAFFGPQMSSSFAARVGMTSYALFDPMWATAALCRDGETPLVCEYRTKAPSIAFIMFGGNDVQHMTYDEYGVQLRLIVEASLAEGVIPVLSTFSYSSENTLWLQALEFNLQVVAVADEYDVPLINLWAAARALPDYGLEGDGIHMMRSGFANIRLDTSFDLTSGVGLRNLLSLVMLDELRRTLSMEG